jgi:hypothetical protein
MEAVDDHGDTPLQVATRCVKLGATVLDSLAIVLQLLLVGKADFQKPVPGADGMTVIDVAICNNWHPPLIGRMIQAGTQAGTLCQGRKWSFAEWCLLNGNRPCLDWLLATWDYQGRPAKLWSAQSDHQTLGTFLDNQKLTTDEVEGSWSFLDRHTCSFCSTIHFQVKNLRKCKRCLAQRYCNKECQSKDWYQINGHRHSCLPCTTGTNGEQL